MDAIELRPLGLGELLDRTFSLYRSHFWLFAGIMAIPSAFSIPLSLSMLSTQRTLQPGGRPSPIFLGTTILLVFAYLAIFWLAYAMAGGAATYAISETYLGHAATVRAAYGRVLGNSWRILRLVLVVWLLAIGMLIVVSIGSLIVIGILAGAASLIGRGGPRGITQAVIGVVMVVSYLAGLGLWFVWALRYAVSIPTLLLEGLGVTAAIRRSVELTRGRRWQIFVAILLCMVVAYAGVLVFQGPFFVMIFLAARAGPPPAWLTFSSAVSGAIGGAITGPLLMIVLVLLYYDSRIRKEAFDLQFMMSSLDAPAAAPGTTLPA